jgi:hypothetical protein
VGNKGLTQYRYVWPDYFSNAELGKAEDGNYIRVTDLVEHIRKVAFLYGNDQWRERLALMGLLAFIEGDNGQ